MAKQRDSILILGEGPTEFYYINSLADRYPGITIIPGYPKHTNMKELEEKIQDGISKGYRYIFCIIDMDNKDGEPYCSQYAKLKNKYSTPIRKPQKGLCCDIRFYETHRCTELFFLYYFKYTSREYASQQQLLDDLNSVVQYYKNTDFFRKCRGLHSYFLKNGGAIENAVKNANRSVTERDSTPRNYTYSELGKLIDTLDTLR